jgi:hypothetical protein
MPAYFVGGVARKKMLWSKPDRGGAGAFFGVDHFQWRQA